MRKLIVLSLVLLAGYLSTAYWPMVGDYFAIRFAAQKLANRTARDGRNHANIRDLLKEVERETGLRLYGHNITITTPQKQVIVEIDTNLPVTFPLISRTHYHKLVITGQATQRDIRRH